MRFKRRRYRTVLPSPLLAAGSVLDLGATALDRRVVVVSKRSAETAVRRDWDVVGQALSGTVSAAKRRSLSKASKR